MLKKIGIGIAVVLVLFVAAVATRPDTYTVTRSQTVSAPASIVYGLVSDFHQWGGWSPWEKLDPTMKKTYDGAPAGQGAQYAWIGNDKVGEGRMTIVGVKPNESVDIKLEFLKPWESTSQTLFSFKPAGTSTEVTWAMNGNNNFMAKAFSFFMDMDKMIGPDFEKGLSEMKVLGEAEAKKQADAAAAAAAAKAAADAAAAAAAAAVVPVAGAVAPAAAH